MNVKLISVAPDAEKTMAYVARVSNPNNQENPSYAKLLGLDTRATYAIIFSASGVTLISFTLI